MSNMVYLMTSLPSLTFGQEPPITLEEFNNDAKDQLSGKHFKAVVNTDIQNLTCKSGLKNIASLFNSIYADLCEARKASAQNRQAKLDRLPKSVLSGNPLEREQGIIKWQWDELTDIEAGKTFTLTEVLVYKLKLQLLIRLNSFSKDKGAKVLADVVNPDKNKEDN